MTKIDINAINPGDQVQVAHGDWHKVVSVNRADDGFTSYKPGEVVNVYIRIMEYTDTALRAVSGLITGHKPAAAPEPVAEWVTEEEWMPGGKEEYGLHHRFSLKHINRLLTAKYGPPPVVKVATERPDRIISSRQVLNWNPYINKWVTCRRCDLDPGDRYVELPKCCGEGEA